MKFTSTLVSLAFAASAIAGPMAMEADVEERGLLSSLLSPSKASSHFKATPIIGCILPFQATAIVTAFNYLLANPQATDFNATATALLSSDFQDFSDSINQLAGIPEGSVTFASRDAFISGSSSQPPLVLQSLDIFWSCSAISWRWISVSGTGDDSIKVKGIDNFYINPQGQIKTTYAEFNSGAWLADLGYPECT